MVPGGFRVFGVNVDVPQARQQVCPPEIEGLGLMIAYGGRRIIPGCDGGDASPFDRYGDIGTHAFGHAIDQVTVGQYQAHNDNNITRS